MLDEVDYKHTGQVRKIDVDALKFAIEKGSSVVLLSPLGTSPTRAMRLLQLHGRPTAPASTMALRAEELIACPAARAC